MAIQHYKKKKKTKEKKIRYKGNSKRMKKSIKIKILKHSMNHEKKLSNCSMIILKFYLKFNIKQNIEKGSKYNLVNK